MPTLTRTRKAALKWGKMEREPPMDSFASRLAAIPPEVLKLARGGCSRYGATGPKVTIRSACKDWWSGLTGWWQINTHGPE